MLYRFLLILSLITSLGLMSNNISASEYFTDNDDIFDTGVTSLMDSVASRDHKAIEFFIKISPLDINKQNIGGATALHLAVRNNDAIAVKILIDSGADANLKDIEGYTPAMRSCFYGYNELFKILDKGANINFALVNEKKDGFIVLNALSENNFCLEKTLKNIIPIRDLSVEKLKDRLNKAFIISLAKDDKKSKDILLKYLNKLHVFERKVSELSRFNNRTHKVKSRNVYKAPRVRKINRSYELREGYDGISVEDIDLSKPKKKTIYKIRKPVSPKENRIKYRLQNNSGNNDLSVNFRESVSDGNVSKHENRKIISKGPDILQRDLSPRKVVKKKAVARPKRKSPKKLYSGGDLLINETLIIE